MPNYIDLFLPHVKGKIDSKGELNGRCPFHHDKQASFSANIDKGLWICYAGCGHGNAYQFAEKMGVDPKPWINGTKEQDLTRPAEQSYQNKAIKYHRYFMDHLDTLNIHKWSTQAIKKTHTGWDPKYKCFTFPIYDSAGILINIRWHKKSQIKGVHGSHWFPAAVFRKPHEYIVWCEGEKDALTLLSHNIPAVTNTNGAGKIPLDLTPLAEIPILYVCFDPDMQGITGAKKVIEKIRKIYKNITIYNCTIPGGLDVTDWMEI